MSAREQAIRVADALAQAIRFLLMDPPRKTLYRDAMKAALNPTTPRWNDR